MGGFYTFRWLHVTALRAAPNRPMGFNVLNALGLNRRPKTLLLSATASRTRQHTSAARTLPHIVAVLPFPVRHQLSPPDS